MPRYSSRDHRLHVAAGWEPERPAERISDAILMSRANSNRYLITSQDGEVLVNTGQPAQAVRHRERFEQLLGRSLDLRVIVFTQSHGDHYSGWEVYGDDAIETIAHRSFPDGVLDRQRLAAFFWPRTQRTAAWGRANAREPLPTPDARITTFVDDVHGFDVGGRAFEAISAPGGETRDSLLLWLPAERTLFTGNHAGALYGAMPNFSTIRGDRLRSTARFIRDVDRILALEPELLITGHDEPIRGKGRIRTDLVRIRNAVEYVHDETVRGMNEGRTLDELLRQIELPSRLKLAPGRSPTSWVVRAVWEEYVGWFQGESPTELYPIDTASLRTELAALAGGPANVARRAAARVAAGQPVEALYLAEIALTADPHHPAALRARIDALESLIERTRGETFDELAYLESELARARAALGTESMS